MTPDVFVRQRLDQLESLLGHPNLTRRTLETLEMLASDEVNKPPLIAWLNEGLARNDKRWEIRTALRCLARVIQPRSYLEIGTRRGWSLAQVVSEVPEVRVYSVDMWIDQYGGAENSGPEFLLQELRRVTPNYCGQITFLTGNSHDILPVFLDGAYADGSSPELELVRQAEARPHLFDLITVDGDHTAVGAWWDLLDEMSHVALGGAVVFDDLVDRSDELLGGQSTSRFANRRAPLTDFRPSLLHVWQHIKRIFGNFIYLENLAGYPPIGVAVRAQ